MTESPWVALGAVEYAEAKRLKSALEERGVELRIASDPDSCGPGGGCKPKLVVLAREADIPRVQEFMAAERKREMGDLEHHEGLADEVYDPEKGEARCPACGTQFSTTLTECPDCGLCFA